MYKISIIRKKCSQVYDKMKESNLKYERDSDTLLWKDFLAGDEKAFENIYRVYVKPLYQYGSKFTLNKEVVLDSIQDLFVELFIHRQNLGETDNIKLYLYVSLKRKLTRTLRKNNLVQSFPDNELTFLSDYSLENEIFDNESEIKKINELNKALNMLTSRQKEAIYLKFVCRLKYEEIAQIMDLNYQSVRNLVCRAIEKLRKILVCTSFLILLLL